jgi:hypothetical protein
MQLPGAYPVRSVLPLNANAPHVVSSTQQDASSGAVATPCAADGFDASTLPLTGHATHIGIAVFPPQAAWDMASAVILVQ